MSSSNVREVFFMKKFKDMIALLLAVLLVISFAACGSSSADASHWDTYVLKVFEEHADTLAELFN